mmetsp:Transcript_17076/g.25862  ORF Transcript_17076/g.25862 Transcript_17076/m.25862 type:complete len:375 (-) Transcript_17076:849-1973(-)
MVKQKQKKKRDSSKAKSFKTCLVVHFDINETVLVGDDAGGDTREDSLNKILAKSAFVRIPSNKKVVWGKTMEQDSDPIEPSQWWDGRAIGEEQDEKVPPALYTGWNWPPGCCPYYRTAFKKRAKRFVHHKDGKQYRDLYNELERRLVFPCTTERKDLPDILSHLLPALFETIETLQTRTQRVRFVFRTFGSDLPDIAKAITAFSRGKHPNYPHFIHPELELNTLVRGRWNEDRVYQLWDYSEERVLASGDTEIVQFLDSHPICGIQDDYEYWAANEWEPSAGKPVWVPKWNDDVHHVLLDDNIHNLEHDSIASVRLQQEEGGSYRTLSGKEIMDAQGLYLIRVPTVEPILNTQWFVEKLDEAQVLFALDRNLLD